MVPLGFQKAINLYTIWITTKPLGRTGVVLALIVYLVQKSVVHGIKNSIKTTPLIKSKNI